MSQILQRIIVLFASLMLAGAALGCERNGTNQGMGGGDQHSGGQQAGDQQAGGQPDDQSGLGETLGMSNDSEESATGGGQQAQNQGQQPGQPKNQGQRPGRRGDQAVKQTREDVADELGIPTSAVAFGSQVRQSIMDAKSDTQRKAWGVVGTVQNQMSRLDRTKLDSQQKQTADQLEQKVSKVKQSLSKMGQAGSRQMDQMDDQLDQQISDIKDDWDQVSDAMQFGQQPAGGGPTGSQQPQGGQNMPGSQDMNNQNMDNGQNMPGSQDMDDGQNMPGSQDMNDGQNMPGSQDMNEGQDSP